MSILNEVKLPLDGVFGPISRKKPNVYFDRLKENRVKAEAEKRARFVRGIGNAVCGYSDGFKDGFEQAVQWLLGELPGPLEASYRPDAGMEYSKTYYSCHPTERKKILEWFEKNGTCLNAEK